MTLIVYDFNLQSVTCFQRLATEATRIYDVCKAAVHNLSAEKSARLEAVEKYIKSVGVATVRFLIWL